MSNCVSFHTQLASIMEVLANAAVAEICKLVDDGYAVLRLEVSESRKENKALKRKLQMMEHRIARGCAETGGGRNALVNNRPERNKICNTSRPTRERVFSKQIDVGLMRDAAAAAAANIAAVDDDGAPTHPVVTWDECADMEEGSSESKEVPVKEERLEEESAPQKGPKCFAQRAMDLGADGGERSPTAKTPTRPANHTEELSEQHRTRHGVWEVSGPEPVLKAEAESECVTKSLQRRGAELREAGRNSLGTDSVMCERNRHLGTYFSQEDGDAEADGPSGLFQPDTDSQGILGNPEPQPSPNMEEGSGSSLSSLSSLDWKTDVVVIDSVPIKEEVEMQSTWKRETFSGRVHLPLNCFGDNMQREEVLPESTADPCPLKTHTAVRQEVAAAKFISPGVQDYGPSNVNFTVSECTDALSLKVGSREKRFFCAFCGKGFSCPKKVEIHQRVHTGEKPFSCTQCRKQFAQAGNLKRHQRVHTGEKPFSCTQCEKRFSHLHQLKMHQKVHTGERPYACPLCGKRFAEKSYLRIHQQRNHSAVYSVR